MAPVPKIPYIFRASKNIPKPETEKRIDAVLKLVELAHARKRLIKTYSKGMQQRVGLAQALINNPDLLILDEPTSGLDPIGRMKVREIIKLIETDGWYKIKARGGHRQYKHRAKRGRVTVPGRMSADRLRSAARPSDPSPRIQA